MSHKEGNCLYDKNHTIQIYDKNREMEERDLNLLIFDMNDILVIENKLSENNFQTFFSANKNSRSTRVLL